MSSGDAVYIVRRDGTRVPGTVVKFSFTGPMDGEPYYEVRYLGSTDHYPLSQLIPVELA